MTSDNTQKTTEIIRHSELSIIGVLIRHPDTYHEIASKIEAKHFENHDTREYFEFFTEQIDLGKQWDEILFLDKHYDLAPKWVDEIMERASVAYLHNYIENVRLKHISRSLFKESAKAQEIDIKKVRDLVEDFYLTDNIDDEIEISDIFDEIKANMNNDAEVVEMDFDLPDLSYRVSGLGRGQVYTIAGRPGHSKSMLLSNLIQKPIDDGYKVLMCDFEMQPVSIGQRLMSIKYNIPLYWHKKKTQDRKTLDKDRKLVYNELAEEIKFKYKGKLKLIKHPTLAQIEANVIKFRPDIITVDTIQAMVNNFDYDKNITEATQISKTYRRLEKMAEKYKCNVIVCTQVNCRDDAILPSKGHMKGSSGIEEASSVIITVKNREIAARNQTYTNETEKSQSISDARGQYEIGIRKNRHGEEIERLLCYNKSTGKFSEGLIIPSIDEEMKVQL